ncbi:unnamed protein product [Choristocarpus tenellus]
MKFSILFSSVLDVIGSALVDGGTVSLDWTSSVAPNAGSNEGKSITLKSKGVTKILLNTTLVLVVLLGLVWFFADIEQSSTWNKPVKDKLDFHELNLGEGRLLRAIKKRRGGKWPVRLRRSDLVTETVTTPWVPRRVSLKASERHPDGVGGRPEPSGPLLTAQYCIHEESHIDLEKSGVGGWEKKGMMMIHQTQRIVYFQVPKAGSSTTRRSLAPWGFRQLYLEKEVEEVGGEKELEEYFAFTVVREPLERGTSAFYTVNNHRITERLEPMPETPKGFTEYIDSLYNNTDMDRFRFYHHVLPMVSMCCWYFRSMSSLGFLSRRKNEHGTMFLLTHKALQYGRAHTIEEGCKSGRF